LEALVGGSEVAARGFRENRGGGYKKWRRGEERRGEERMICEVKHEQGRNNRLMTTSTCTIGGGPIS